MCSTLLGKKQKIIVSFQGPRKRETIPAFSGWFGGWLANVKLI
jgi:hypothetical protein